ncbi:MAG: hypothetical protein CM1200mP22_04530 [Dehalococcoidia bacterium]|nr:MAG: hypothetical protein CM1200mP22_04530 [Dehalococcoidia bacterium]
MIQIVAIAMGGETCRVRGSSALPGIHTYLVGGHDCRTRFRRRWLVIFAMWSPLRAMVGAFLIRRSNWITTTTQTIGAPVFPFILDMLPYLIIIFVMSLWSRAAARAMPKGEKRGVLRAPNLTIGIFTYNTGPIW